MIKISVIIPVYNMADYIQGCLNSLTCQTLNEFEAICVDDGSSDRSADIVTEYSQKDSRVRLIRFKENRGVFAARNCALESARGEFVAFLDPDDWYPEPDILEAMYTAAKEHNIDICGGGWTNHYPDKAPQTKFGGTLWGLSCFDNPGVINYKDYQFDFGYQRFIYRTALLRKHNITFPPYTRYQDPPFFVRAMTAAGRFYGMNRSTYNYRASYKTVDFAKNGYRKALDLIKGMRDNIEFSKHAGFERLHTLMYDRCNNMTNCFAAAIRNSEEAFVGVCGLELLIDKEVVERNRSLVTSGIRPYMRALQELFQEKNWVDSGLVDFKTIRTALDYYADYVSDGDSEDARRHVVARFWRAAQRPAGTPKVSILIPAYNVQDSVGASIESALGQTMSDIEIICVDDGSTDCTWDVICNYARRDCRVVPIRHNRNLGLYMARKTAVLSAVGEYMACLDSDDILPVNACADACRCAADSGADIVQGHVEIVNVGKFPESRLDWIRKLTVPYPTCLDGKDLLAKMFIDRNIGTSVWGKIYARALLLKAFNALGNVRITMAEDIMASFAIATFARKYAPQNSPFYKYSYGTGITGKAELTLDQYKAQCCGTDVIPELKRFKDEYGANNPMLNKAFTAVRSRLLNDAYGRVESFLPIKSLQREGMRHFADKIGALEFVKYLAERFFGNRAALIQRLDYLEFVPRIKAKRLKTIGIFYFHLTQGGVQRVISLLVPMFQHMGYKIVMFLEKKINGACFSLPDTVELVYLPESQTTTSSNIAHRLELLAQEIQALGVDVMYYHANSSHIMQWDLLVCKLVSKIPFVLHYHSCVGQSLCAMQTVPAFSCLAAHMRMCDKVIALGRIDELYFKSQGVDAVYIPNPPAEELYSGVSRPSNLDRKTILWCARISWEKHPLDPIVIFDKIHRHIPDARLVIVGGGAQPIVAAMEKRIKELGLGKYIEMTGGQNDTYQYYRTATAFLMTSSFEGFPMTLLEAGAFGVPTVMYSLPFLEMVRGNKGIAQVAQGDINEAASALCRILSDESIYRTMSEENYRHTSDFLTFNQDAAWQKVFFDITERASDCDERDKSLTCGYNDVKILLEELQYCYKIGFNAFIGKIRNLDRELKRLVGDSKDLKAKNENLQKTVNLYNCRLLQRESNLRNLSKEISALHNSESYRVGMFVTWPARKAWGGVKCLRENGFKYTAKHAAGKVLRLFGSTCRW